MHVGHKATTIQWFNVGPSSARQRIGGGPMMTHINLKKKKKKKKKKNVKFIWTPSDKIFWVRASDD